MSNNKLRESHKKNYFEYSYKCEEKTQIV